MKAGENEIQVALVWISLCCLCVLCDSVVSSKWSLIHHREHRGSTEKNFKLGHDRKFPK
jgi:hypothetical protein